LEWEVPECLGPADRFIDLRDHPLEKVAWWGSKPWLDAYPGWTINDILGTICGDKGLRIDFDASYTPLKFVRRAELAGKVVFVPGSAVSAKMWPASSWLELAEKLDAVVVAAAVDVVQALAPLPLYETPSISDALDAVSSARAVIAVDTGIMHMAVHQGTPTVGIFRASPVYARERENFVAVEANKPCESICYMREIGCGHNGRPLAGKGFVPTDWSCLAPSDQRCMETITPDMVLAALDEATGRRGRRRQRTGTLQ
jgi:ADP-heptose:LPS heptosyltransferase